MVSPQYIFGKYNVTGWIVGYNTNESGYISILVGNTWKNVYNLGQDTSWHEYMIKYNKPTGKLSTYVDGSPVFTYENFSYVNLANTGAFSIGNAAMLNSYGPGTYSINSDWFGGEIDYLKIMVNTSNAVNYNLNECAGQVAKDSAAYFYSDRTYPGVSTCGATHFMLGYMPSKDTCDPEWVTGETPGKPGSPHLVPVCNTGIQAQVIVSMRSIFLFL